MMVMMVVVVMGVMVVPMSGIVDARYEKIRFAQSIAVDDARRSRRRGRRDRQSIGSANGAKQNAFQTIDHIAILHVSLAHAGENQMFPRNDLAQSFPSLRPSYDQARAELSASAPAPAPGRSVVGYKINIATSGPVQVQMRLPLPKKNLAEPRLDNLLA